MKTRPALLLMLLPVALLPLAGCGFHPLYGENDLAVESPSVNAELAQVFVNNLPERSGQLLRQALQARLGGDGDSPAQKYRLMVYFGLSAEAIGIHGDNSSGRTRVVGDASWVLSRVSDPPQTLTHGRARSVDGFNVIDEQYFASTLANDATTQRIAGNVANDIAQQLAIWFKAHPGGITTTPVVAPLPPRPLTQPNGAYLQNQTVPGDSGDQIQQAPGLDGMPSGALGLQRPIQ